MKRIFPLFLLALAGCGSDKDSDQQKELISHESAWETIVIDEDTKKDVVLKLDTTYEEASNEAIEFNGASMIRAQIKGDELHLKVEAFKVTRNVDSEVKINLEVDGDDVIYTVPVRVENTSGDAELAELIAYQQNIDKLLSFKEERAIFFEYLNLGLGSGDLTEREFNLFSSSYTELLKSLQKPDCAYCTSDKVQELVVSYQAGDATEDQIQSVIDSLKDQVKTQGTILNSKINEIGFLTYLPELGNTEYYENNGIISQFIGNPKFGEFVDGKFQFKGDYRDVYHILSKDKPDCCTVGKVKTTDIRN